MSLLLYSVSRCNLSIRAGAGAGGRRGVGDGGVQKKARKKKASPFLLPPPPPKEGLILRLFVLQVNRNSFWY